jgi:hypothetical protein
MPPPASSADLAGPAPIIVRADDSDHQLGHSARLPPPLEQWKAAAAFGWPNQYCAAASLAGDLAESRRGLIALELRRPEQSCRLRCTAAADEYDADDQSARDVSENPPPPPPPTSNQSIVLCRGRLCVCNALLVCVAVCGAGHFGGWLPTPGSVFAARHQVTRAG